MREVAVTGLGVICASGADVASFRAAMQAGASAIGPIENFPTGTLRFPNAAQVRGFDPTPHFEGKEINYVDRFAQLGMVAAREAVANSGIEWTAPLREATAIATGSALGGKYTEDEGYFHMYAEGRPRFDPLAIPKAMMNAVSSRISMEFGITGPAWTVSTACSSANHAIGQAFRMVQAGEVELAIAGGAESPFTLGVLRAWEAMRVVSTDTCRPFSADRKGLILGEGAAMLVLEPLDAARARGAHVYGLISGFGMSADAHHITQPAAAGAARAMRAALRVAGLAPERVRYINAHGTGTAANDPAESSAIREVFGDHAGAPLVSSTKSMHGHALGAAGAIEAVATLLAIEDGIVPPTANFTTHDPACDLDCVPNIARRVDVEHALSNSFAFGGLNAVLAFSRAR